MNNGNPGASVDGPGNRPGQSVEDVVRQITVCELGSYRYTNAADAVAAARRGAR